jgi:hypothetical protein
MSDTTSDTSAIDEKNAENEGTSSSNTPNWYKFGQNIFSTVIFIILYFGIGIGVLYSCKIAQSNIFPTDADCFPFSDAKPTVTPIQTNIFKTYTDPNAPKSIKLSFPYDENSDFEILKTLREYKNSYDSNNIMIYFISIIETLVWINFKFISTTSNVVNSLPEGLVVLLGPFILGITWFILFFCNCIYGMFLWFYNMSWFFKKNTNTKKGEKPVWEDVTMTQPFGYGMSIFLVIMLSLILLFFAPFFIGGGGLISSFCLLMILTYTGVMVDKSAGYLTVLKEAAKVYKISLMVIFSIFLVSSAFTYLGIPSGIVSLLVIGCIYFGIINMDIYKSITETNLTPFIVEKELQAKRIVCTTAEPQEKHGLMYQMIFGKDKQSGGSLVNDLKKFNRKYK